MQHFGRSQKEENVVKGGIVPLTLASWFLLLRVFILRS